MYNVFQVYDKNDDGNLDYDDFLQLVLPYDNVKLRAKIAQRPTYKAQQLAPVIEFELSRLFEKEVHYHVKVEEEKKTLERQPDFNTVACFTVIDAKNFGYLDFDQIYAFMSKYDAETN